MVNVVQKEERKRKMERIYKQIKDKCELPKSVISYTYKDFDVDIIFI
jgi:hypothetical protein